MTTLGWGTWLGYRVLVLCCCWGWLLWANVGYHKVFFFEGLLILYLYFAAFWYYDFFCIIYIYLLLELPGFVAACLA